ncbi:hypothetical protein ACG00X_06075 [Roseateles sp. BYS96W]|uniref:Uncharacterized protein n=1 Tax=Pelomonas nitida TaxID=3299027 RepID=A0ABW7G384_9BURK
MNTAISPFNVKSTLASRAHAGLRGARLVGSPPEFDTKQPFRAFSASGSIWNQQLRRALVDFL